MTLEEKAASYAEKAFSQISTSQATWEEVKQSYAQAYLDGATEALESQWVSVENELPEEKKVVLCHISNMKDSYAENDAYFDITILRDGEFLNLDGEIIHPTHWMPIPEPCAKGGDKNE